MHQLHMLSAHLLLVVVAGEYTKEGVLCFLFLLEGRGEKGRVASDVMAFLVGCDDIAHLPFQHQWMQPPPPMEPSLPLPPGSMVQELLKHGSVPSNGKESNHPMDAMCCGRINAFLFPFLGLYVQMVLGQGPQQQQMVPASQADGLVVADALNQVMGRMITVVGKKTQVSGGTHWYRASQVGHER